MSEESSTKIVLAALLSVPPSLVGAHVRVFLEGGKEFDALIAPSHPGWLSFQRKETPKRTEFIPLHTVVGFAFG